MAICMFLIGLSFGEEDKANDQQNPELTKMIEKLAAEAQALGAIIPEGSSEEEKEQLKNEHAKLQKLIVEKLLPLCANQVFAQEVKTQNDKHVSLDEIKSIDEQWQNAEDELPIHAEKMGNACAKEIVRLVKELKVVGECFVMDNQGANVGQNALTSDYWQGDEGKWKNSFNEGKGGVVVEERKYDKSSDTVDQKVALPILDAEGKVIGSVCYGVIINKL